MKLQKKKQQQQQNKTNIKYNNCSGLPFEMQLLNAAK